LKKIYFGVTFKELNIIPLMTYFIGTNVRVGLGVINECDELVSL